MSSLLFNFYAGYIIGFPGGIRGKNLPAKAEDIRDVVLVAQAVKRLPVMRETQVRSLGREDPLEREMATYSSILAWKIPWRKEPGGLQYMGLQKSRT